MYNMPQYKHNAVEDNTNMKFLLDSRLPPQSRYDLRSSGILCSVYWQFLTDVSGQPIDILGCPERRQGVLGCSETWARITTARCVIPQKSADLMKFLVCTEFTGTPFAFSPCRLKRRTVMTGAVHYVINFQSKS